MQMCPDYARLIQIGACLLQQHQYFWSTVCINKNMFLKDECDFKGGMWTCQRHVCVVGSQYHSHMQDCGSSILLDTVSDELKANV